ncbi:MAG: hypothetical protein OEZ32_05275 [Nitrospinota bacterium]|nr:hypothetical protein [Nitrospinota bacterium]
MNQTIDDLPMVVAALLFSIAFFIVYFLYHLPRRALAKKAAAILKLASLHIGGTVKEGWYSARLTSRRYGREAIVRLYPVDSDGEVMLALKMGLSLKVRGGFLISPLERPETQTPGALLETLGILSIGPVVIVDNPEMDQRFRVISFHQDFVRNNLRSNKKAEAVSRAFGLGAAYMLFNGKRITLIWDPFSTEELELAPSMFEKSLSALGDIAEGMIPAASTGISDSFESLKKVDILSVILIFSGGIIYFIIKLLTFLNEVLE